MAEYREVSRTNCEGGTAVLNYAVCRPEHLDILWSSTAKTLSQLMAAYSGTWQRASNSNYFNTTTGDPFGYVIKNHTVLNPMVSVGKKFDGWWIDDDVYNSFVDPTTDFLNSVDLNKCWMGINVGPMLVSNGAKTNLSAEIAEADYSGLQPASATSGGSPILRVGMGWSYNQDRIIHVLCRSGGYSLYDLQDFFMEFPGITFAIAFDGGGSVGMIDTEIGPNVIGNDVRIMKTAFVITDKDSIPAGFPS